MLRQTVQQGSSMRYKTIGAPGGPELKVSVIGLGCNAFGRRCDEAATAVVIGRCLDEGINFFDTANSYSDGLSEQFIGRALGARRSDVIIATKFGVRQGAKRETVFAAVDLSLKNLGTDYIDLYQLHFPDPNTPIAETLEAMDRLVRDGKVRVIGCSNFTGALLEEALRVSKDNGFAAFATAQNPYSILERDIEEELVPVCRARGIGILPYYPLFRGMLTGKYKRGEPAPVGTRLATDQRWAGLLRDETVFDRIDALTAFAADRGHGILDLALAWLASQDTVPSVISGATKPEQITANAKGANWVLGAEDHAAIDTIVPPPT
jgi:aryl-alcohol dehydrogenase-like predicted oxidoreductase